MQTNQPTAPHFGERYRAVRVLKEGQGITTLLGEDLRQRTPVVIKALEASSVSPAAHLRLEHEAGILRRVHSPYLTPLLEINCEGETLRLVIPYVPGVTLQSRLAQGPLSVRETLVVGQCLLAALHAVHTEDVLHRDIKPANIIVTVDSQLTRAVLIDFGLARSSRLDPSLRDIPAGTARYMSPEQAGLLAGSSVDARSDLYAVGIVLFECLTGHPPFQSEDLGELLRQHLSDRAPELRSLGVVVPRILDEIVQRLLRKDPRDRYQIAEAVLGDLDDLAAALERGIEDPVLVVGARDRRKTLAEPVFMGRERELAVLGQAWSRAKTGSGGLVFLEGLSGGGKSRLLDEFTVRCRQLGAWVAWGHGVDRTAQHPFKLLNGIVHDVLARSRTDRPLADRLREGVGPQKDAVCAVLPPLTAVLGEHDSRAAGPEMHGEVRALAALTALLNTLGSVDRPAVVILDDCQWSDDLTVRLLGHWHRAEGRARHLLLVAAFRTEEVAMGDALRSITPSAHIVLSPLSEGVLRGVVESMTGPLPDDALAVITRLSEGSPFMAAAVAQGMVESGVLVPAASGWRSEPQALSEVRASDRAGVFLSRRLERLTWGTRRFLSVGAVLGKEFATAEAASLTQQTRPQVVLALEEARGRQLLWMDADRTRCAFVHDKVREALLQHLSNDERTHLHRLVARHLAEIDRDRVFDLAHHFDAAGDHEAALPYALAAAQQAREQHALEIAERNYRIADRGAIHADRAVQQRVTEGLGDVLMLRGQYKAAGQYFARAKELTQEKVEQARIEGKLGELAFKQGDLKQASQVIEQALRLLGRQIPRNRAILLAATLWEALIQVFHVWFPKFFLARRSLEGAENELLAVRFYSRLAYTYYFTRTVPAIWAHLREINLAECYPPTRELGQAYSNHVPIMVMIPYFSRAIAYGKKSLAIRKAIGDRWGEGQSRVFYGFALRAAGRYREAVAVLEEAIKLLDQAGDRWESNCAALDLGLALYRLGYLQWSAQVGRQTYKVGLEIGERKAIAGGLNIWSKATGGDIPAEITQSELRQPNDDVEAVTSLMQAEALRLLRTGLPGQAASMLEEAQRLLEKAGMRLEEATAILPLLATVLRREAETVAVAGHRSSTRKKHLRRVNRVARQALRVARKFPNNLPHALREKGLIAAMQGKRWVAYNCLTKSLSIAEMQEASMERAQTILAKAQVGMTLGWPEAAEDMAQAKKAIHTLGAGFLLSSEQSEAFPETITVSLSDRLTKLGEAGRKIVLSTTKQSIYSAVQEAALGILRGDRCVILASHPDKDGRKWGVVLGADHTFSQTVAERALREGRPVVMTEGFPESTSDSVLLSGSRSILCAPIAVRGKVPICFYVTHQKAGKLFGREEEQLAQFIAELAEKALETSEYR